MRLVFAVLLLALSPAAASTGRNGTRPHDLWPLLEAGRKCADAVGRSGPMPSQLQCQFLAIRQGHDYYQYNTARRECLTARNCSDRVSALMWKIYHNKEEDVEDDDDDDEDETDDEDEDEDDGHDGHDVDGSSGKEEAEGDEHVGRTASHVTVQLKKQYVPVYRDGAVVAHKTAYSGNIEIGMGSKPQRFSVVFDTGSGHLLLPSLQCKSEACLVHRRYNASASASVLAIDHDGHPIVSKASDRDQVAIDFGTGSVVGEFAYETVCLGPAEKSSDWTLPTADGPIRGVPQELGKHPRALGRGCVRLRVVLATDMTKDPFYNFEFDGVLGLGLEGMALDHEFSFFGQLTRQLQTPRPVFAVYISRDDSTASELSFGGVDARRFDTEMLWTPVLSPHLGYWQVAIKSIHVRGEFGDKVLESCEDGTCIAILDTGTSLLGVPDVVATQLHPQLARLVPGDPEEIDCRYFPGPDLVFDLGNFEVTLTAEEYSRPTAMRVTGGVKPRTLCRASMLRAEIGPPLGPKAFILGEPVLRRYYTAYNWRSRKVGFALAKHSSPSTSDQAANLIAE